MPANSNARGNPVFGPKLRKCRTCRGAFPAGSLVAGECSACAGLLALPLRGEGGRYIALYAAKQGQQGGGGR
jgi:hypothetical protein